jgi:hypothetical protein
MAVDSGTRAADKRGMSVAVQAGYCGDDLFVMPGERNCDGLAHQGHDRAAFRIDALVAL